ncbi:glycosyltransferase family 2 protein [Cyanobium sp. HWJ4-Hawea]|uniref:hypothetical protein n=1 Tax=Cyanobium sp. HWJ4-Hawea TaxID=2823713 RepID=UPI0020CC0C68|nr:hypothetical protein [Cyanobium sp. HWJ4-Hawea]MCP9808497.1 glycosyltransferase family 2 protein [Cyanobium sp. HWJ4-Hawea]
MTFEVPILLIAWRRPHTLRQVIDAIRPVAPTRLYVACDGPNPSRPGEAEKVAATRRLIEEEIDWPCQINRLYSDVNQGCKLGVSRAITWFFEQVEEGIIVEDDCVPHPSFFAYCETLLDKYRLDTRVWCISGNNFQEGRWRGDGSYYFSRYNHCWGWASWRRCWQHYDRDLSKWPALRDSGLLTSIFPDPAERRHWSQIWQRLFDKDEPDTWDIQWLFTVLANGGLTASPNRNLVVNVGFGQDATHTTGASITMTASLGIDPHRHTLFQLQDHSADRFTFDHHFGGRWRRLPGLLVWLPLRAAALISRKPRRILMSMFKQ